MLLAFETVARTASACVSDGATELAYRDLHGREAEIGLVDLLQGLIRDLGAPTHLAVSVGPGSFTGLRIGVIAARTLAWLDDLPVHGVDSLVALALEQGDGLWWTLMPLKRDTTFHGLFEVAGGSVAILEATRADRDADAVVLHPRTRDATAIGPALAAKPALARHWCPGIAIGAAAHLTARGVAKAAASVPAASWRDLLPAYHLEAAPVLQRRATSDVARRTSDL
ncbi:MAG: tRNA (adenosine(37)-N6)-threonylcarbamoyltransferase complex dimerization subunit type 1 TsaB [Planctomycetes bacterium]|nr:tRNA (adenosine(37)-N6)-threonylcarbamoyltransferase complex dimerization subunit type 1 TsaB [Planctomycetota bacterium]